MGKSSLFKTVSGTFCLLSLFACSKLTKNGSGNLEGALVAASTDGSSTSSSSGASVPTNSVGCSIHVANNVLSFSPYVPVNEASGYLTLITCPQEISISISNSNITNLVVHSVNGVQELRLKDWFTQSNTALNTTITMYSPSNAYESKSYRFELSPRTLNNAAALYRTKTPVTTTSGGCTTVAYKKAFCPRGSELIADSLNGVLYCSLYSKPLNFQTDGSCAFDAFMQSDFIYDAESLRLYLTKAPNSVCPIGTTQTTANGLGACTTPKTFCLVGTLDPNFWPMGIPSAPQLILPNLRPQYIPPMPSTIQNLSGAFIRAKNVTNDVIVSQTCNSTPPINNNPTY